MSLPPEVDAKIRKNFGDLLEQANQAEVQGGVSIPHAMPGDFVRLKEKFLLLLAQLKPYNNSRLDEIIVSVENLRPIEVSDLDGSTYEWYTDFDILKNLIQAVKESFEHDMLGSLTELIVAAVSADYLLQAKALLDSKYHIASAVLIGAVLEDGLRRLCLRQHTPISINKSNGQPKTLNIFIDDLKQANLYSELKAKQLRAWADIRNKAAHGDTSVVKIDDVELMYQGVENFLADYL